MVQIYAAWHFLFFLIIILLIEMSQNKNVFSTTDVFFSQYCYLSNPKVGNNNFACTTTSPQQNVIKTALALAQLQRPDNQRIIFKLSVSYTGNPTSTFNIVLDYVSPTKFSFPTNKTMSKMGLFLVVIKSQPTQQFVDLVKFEWNAGSNVDNYDNSNRTATTSINLPSNTIFLAASIPTLVKAAFVTYLKIEVSSSSNIEIEWQVSTTINSPNIKVDLQVENRVRIQEFGGFVLLFNPIQVAAATTAGFNISYLNVIYTMGSQYDLTDAAEQYGPGFTGKCLLGHHRIKYQNDQEFEFRFQFTSKGNLSVFKEIQDQKALLQGTLFCFGNSTQCAQGSTYTDMIDGKCYTPSTCPLPVPSNWSQTDFCPNCTQLVCEQCTVTNRSQCIKCKVGTSTHLNGSRCVCDANYIPKTVPISTASEGKWNNMTNSLVGCFLNCTIVIPFCAQTQCMNSTYCMQCFGDTFVDNISATEQICTKCSSAMTNCTNCTDRNLCVSCAEGSYLSDEYNGSILTGSICFHCMKTLKNCLNCSDNETCLDCELGYYLNLTTKQCQCNFTYSNLTKCLQCSIFTHCTLCQQEYFPNTTTGKCQQCRQIHPNCTLCSNENVCSQCEIGYLLDPSVQIGRVLCSPCRKFISNCTQCPSITQCSDCDTYFGLDSSQMCQSCHTLLMPGCLKCQDSSLCLQCDSFTHKIYDVCHYCNQIFKCIDCFVNKDKNGLDFLQCITCESGYIAQTLKSNEVMCLRCVVFIDNCYECTSQTQCVSCIKPYVLSVNGICDACQNGYRKYDKYCMKYPGCQATTLNKDGKQICISCIQQLHFQYKSSKKQCFCTLGYKPLNLSDGWFQCYPICGDGIIQQQYEQCDDGNLQVHDGCNYLCKIQTDFQCVGEPSRCILHVNFQTFQLLYTYRNPGQNSGILTYYLSPKHQALQRLDWSRLISFNFSLNSADKSKFNYRYVPQLGHLQIQIPYTQELQGIQLQTQLVLDSQIVVSQPSQFKLFNRISGVNLPLIFERDSVLQANKTLNMFFFILAVLFLVQFYLASYFHKMIGLQTIQVIQIIYFVRLIVSSKHTTLLHSSINSAKISATGYSNQQVIFGNTQMLNKQAYLSQQRWFLSIDLKKYFTLNINFFLIPLIMAFVLYLITYLRKIHQRNKCYQIQEWIQRQKLKQFRESLQRTYDHYVFTFVMMFNLASFFSVVLYESLRLPQVDIQSGGLQALSLSIHHLVLFSPVVIFAYETFFAIAQYILPKKPKQLFQEQPKLWKQKIRIDQQTNNKQNYHILYVFVYLVYYLIVQLTIVGGTFEQDQSIGLQLGLVTSVIYLLIVAYWRPYDKAVKKHNYFLVLNHSTVVIFMIFCEVFDKSESATNQAHVAMVYITMALLTFVVIGGYVRIYLQFQYQRRRPKKYQVEFDEQQMRINNQQSKHNSLKQKNPLLSKRQNLLMNNQYAFKNQLKQLSKLYDLDSKKDGPFCGNDKRKLSDKEEQFIIQRIRQDYNKKKREIFLEESISDNLKRHRDNSNQIHHENIFNSKLNIENQLQAQQNPFIEQVKRRNINQKDQNLKDKQKKAGNISDKQTLQTLKRKMRHQFKMMYQN